MDTPLIFSNCNFSMTEGAIIRTSEEADFTAFLCKFFCCEEMWQGIEAKDGGKVVLWSCEIEDARIALQVDEDTPYSYLYSNRFNRFNRNHIAITNGSAQPGSGTLNFAAFLGNRFECTEETNAAYDGPYFPASNWSVAHILLDHCASSFSPGIYTQFSNYFLDADHGIYLVDAAVMVQNALFLNLGIDGIATHWEFASNAYAGSHVKATGCTFTNAGIYAYGYVNINILDQAEISGNSFDLNLPDGNGDPAGIVNRAIWVDMLFRYDNTAVNGNTITVDDALLDAGIVFDNQFGAGNEVSHNTVTAELGQFTSGEWYSFYGLDLFNNTMGVTMCDNSVTGTRDGIRFLGNNGLSNFRSNSFGEHNTGLSIEDFSSSTTFIGGSIGDQIGHGNTWLTTNGAYSDKAARVQSQPGNSDFLIENAYSPCSGYFPYTNLLSPSSGWFRNESISSDWCAPGPPPGPGLSDRDLEVAGETGFFSSLNAVSKWEERRLLLDKLLRYPALKAGNQDIVDFYNAWIDSLPGRYAQMSYDIRQALSIDSTDQVAIDQLKSERDTLYAQLVALEAGVEIPEDPEDVFEVDEEWVADKEAVYAEIAENQADEATLKAQIRQGQLAAAEDLLELNDSLPAVGQYEINHRLLNRLTLQLFLNDTLTAAEEAPPSGQSGTLTILNLTGHIITEQTKPADQDLLVLPTSGIPSGIYLICFAPDSGGVVSAKVVIQH